MVSVPNPPPSASPPVFFRRNYLWVLAILAFAYGFVAVLVPIPAIELPLGLLTLLLIPGYALGALALGPTPRWPWTLMLAITVGLSVAFSVGEGLVLLAFHLGLPAAVFAIVSLGLVVIALATFPSATTQSAADGGFQNYLAGELRLPGHSPTQRVVAAALLLAIIVVFAGIVYLSTVTPNQHPGIQMGIVGPDGLTNDLPSSGSPGANLTVYVTVGNNATQETLNLIVVSTANDTTPSSYTTIGWKLPLVLGANTTTKPDTVSLSPKSTSSVKVEFTFETSGIYVLLFQLQGYTYQPGATLESVSFVTTILPAT